VRDVDHSRPSSAKVKNEWSDNSTPAICICSVDKNNFIFYSWDGKVCGEKTWDLFGEENLSDLARNPNIQSCAA
jgi:hypothetical protein